MRLPPPSTVAVSRSRLVAPVWLLLAGCATAVPTRPELPLPLRSPGGVGGEQLVAELAALDLPSRQAVLWQQFEAGNVPSLLARLVPVTIRRQIAGRERTATFWVTPDYFGFGRDGDWCRMPMSPPLAQSIAERLGCVLPTRRMVDAIWSAAPAQLEPFPFSPREHDITALPLFFEHHRQIELQFEQWRGDGTRDQLVAGIKKDVVASPLVSAYPGRVVIYGWHRRDGRPIQPLSKVHSFSHVDYSHGVRLVAQRMVLDGRVTSVDAVMADAALHELLSDEGPFLPRVLPPDAP